MPLTDAAIRNAKPAEKPLKLTDGAGLYLEVTPAGGKHWRYRFRLAGRVRIPIVRDRSVQFDVITSSDSY